METSKAGGYRKVWRMTAESPMGEILELVPDVEAKAPPRDWPTTPTAFDALRPRLPDASAEANWQSSTYDLLSGLTVRDVTDTIPGDIFDELFKPDPFQSRPKRRF